MQTQASQPVPNRSLEYSQKLYQHLLRAYPRRHREEYGGAMLQLFRDQCRDAWAEGQTRALAGLWFRTLPDLVKTSLLERWSNFKPGKFMADKLNAVLPPRNSPTFAFFAVFLTVFLLVFSATVFVTWLLPKSYASTARIKTENFEFPDAGHPEGQSGYDPYFVQNTLEFIRSPVVLNNVIASLDLNEKWGKRYYGGTPLKTAESFDLLKRQIDVKPVHNTDLISITVYSDDKNEAAALANAIAQSYKAYREAAFRTATESEITVLHFDLVRQASQIAQLQSETDDLAHKFGIVENWDTMRKTYQNQAIDGERTMQALHAQLQALHDLTANQLRDTLPAVTGDAALTELLERLHDSQQQLASLKNDYAPTNPHIVRVQSTITEISREIDGRVSGIMTALQSEAASKRAAVDSLNDMIGSQKPTAENQPYWDKKAELDQLLAFHNSIETKMNELKLTQLNPPAVVEITDVAMPGEAPIKPNKTLNIAFGTIAGIFLGAVAGLIAAFIASRTGKRKLSVEAV